MTVAEFKAQLEASAVDPFEEIKFFDKDGNAQVVTLVQIGQVQSLIPSQPADPAYLRLQLQMPS